MSLSYNLKDVGMNYDRSLFGMKLSDCRALAKALEHTETLVHLDLSNNSLDDDKVGYGGFLGQGGTAIRWRVPVDSCEGTTAAGVWSAVCGECGIWY